MKALTRRFEEIFSIDVRILAFLRIGLASIVLVDLFQRLPFLKDFYTDKGILPRSLAVSRLDVNALSLHLLGNGVEFQLFLFWTAVICAGMLLVGYKTRLSVFLTWLFLCSAHNRNPFILHETDKLIELCLFWCLFLPLGAAYSVDLSLQRKTIQNERYFSMAGVALLFQIMFFYVFTAFSRTGFERYGLVAVGPVVIDLFQWAPFLLFFPWMNRFIRFVLVIVFLIFHVMMSYAMDVHITQFIYLLVIGVFFPLSLIVDRSKKEASSVRITEPTYVSVLLAGLLMLVFFQNMHRVDPITYKDVPLKGLLSFLNLDQSWRASSFDMLKKPVSFLVIGKTDKGVLVDVRSMRDEKLQSISAVNILKEEYRWSLYIKRLDRKLASQRLRYGHYLCTQWNGKYSQGPKLVEMNMILLDPEGHAPHILQYYACKGPNKISNKKSLDRSFLNKV